MKLPILAIATFLCAPSSLLIANDKLDDRSVTWSIDKLSAQEGLLLQLEVECREPTTQACLTATVSGGRLVATFNKADIDNNVKVGDGQSFKVTANFMSAGAQKKLQGAASVTVVK